MGDKQPWQMTLEEFRALVPAPRRIREGLWRVEMETSKRRSGSGSSTSIAYPDEATARRKAPSDFHWHFIFEAIYRGDPVPESVLALYPALQREQEQRRQRLERRAMRSGSVVAAPVIRQAKPRLSR